MAADEPRLDDGQWTALSVLGFLYLRLGDWERAERLFKALAAIRPGDGTGAASLAAAALGRGDWAAALEYLDRPEAGVGSHLRLMTAQALRGLGRAGEAEAVMAEYLAAASAPGEAGP